MFTQMARLGFDIDTKPIKDANRELERMPKAAGQAEKSARGLDMSAAKATAAFAALGAAAVVAARQYFRLADTWSDLSSRVQIAIGRHQDASVVMERLSGVARMTYSSLEATADSFARNSFVLKALGKSTEEQLDFTEALNNAMVVSGAKGQAMEMVQNSLGRAMAEGTLKSQELQNVMNYGSRVAEVLAQELGVNVTQLRQLANDGKITGDVIYSALVKNMELLREEADSMPATVGDAFILIRNAVLETVGVFDQQAQISNEVAESLISVADAIRNIDTSGLVEFARNSRYEFEQLFVVMGAAATIIQGGFGFGGLQVIQDALSNMRSMLDAIKLDKIAKDVDRLTDSTDLYGESAEDLEKRMLANGDALIAYFAAQENAVPITEEAAEAAKEAASAAKEYERNLQSLQDRLDPVGAAARKLKSDVELLVRAIKQGDAEASIVHDWLDAEVAIKSTHRAVKELADEADPFAEIWKNTTQRVQGWFADAFYDILDKGKVTFDGLLDMFKRMAAEMMAQKIMLNITGGGGGGGNFFGGLFGGGGGGFGGGASGASGGGGSNILSAASWLNAGKTLWSGFKGMLAGEGWSGFSGIFGGGAGGGGVSMKGMMANMAAMWPMAVILGMYQSGKLYDEGVRPDMGETWNSTNGNIIGQMGNVGPTIMSGIFDFMDKSLGGGKIAAILTGSTFHQALWNGINQAIWGGEYQTTRGGIQLGFGDEGFDPMQWERQTKKGGAFGSTKRRYRFNELDPEAEQAFHDVYAATIDQVAGLYDMLGINIAEGALEAVRIAELKIGTAGKSEQTEEEIQEQIEQWFNSLTDAMVAAILPDMSKEQLQAIATALAPLRALLSADAAGGARADYALSSSPDRATRVYTQSADALRTMINEYDGSVESINSLTEAMAMQQQLTYELTTAYLQVSDAVSILFGNLSENIRMSLMGAEELYEYQRQQMHTLSDALATMTDPEQILATSQQIERLVSQLWSGLDDGQRQGLGEEYLEFLDRAEALAQTRLSEGMKTVEQTQADLVSGMREQLALAASEMMQAALEQRQAAQMNLMAAEQMGVYLGQYGMNYAPEVNG